MAPQKATKQAPPLGGDDSAPSGVVVGDAQAAAYVAHLQTRGPSYNPRVRKAAQEAKGAAVPTVDPRALNVPVTAEVGPGHGDAVIHSQPIPAPPVMPEAQKPHPSNPVPAPPDGPVGPQASWSGTERAITRRPKAFPRVEFVHGPLGMKVPAVSVSSPDPEGVLVIWFAVPEVALPVSLTQGAALTVRIDGVERNCVYTGVYASAGDPGDCWAMIFIPNAPAPAPD